MFSQSGDAHIADLFQSDGTDLTANIFQEGTGAISTITQQGGGTRLDAATVQYGAVGVGNNAEILQDGRDR